MEDTNKAIDHAAGISRTNLGSPFIPPTPGRIVWYRPAEDAKHLLKHTPHPGYAGPLAATIAGVLEDGRVNLSVLGFDGSGPYAFQSVTLIQEGSPGPGQCCWMPYQKGQAAKEERAERGTLVVGNHLTVRDIEKLKAAASQPGAIVEYDPVKNETVAHPAVGAQVNAGGITDAPTATVDLQQGLGAQQDTGTPGPNGEQPGNV